MGRYAEAREAFASLVAAGGGPEAQDGLGNALRWLGEFDACLQARERAHQGYLERGDWAGAALVAAALAADSELLRGEHAVAQGWFGRARELLEDQPDAPAMAWVAVMQAEQRFLGAGDAGAALEAGEFAIEAGRRGGDVDLELLGRALRGLSVASPRTSGAFLIGRSFRSSTLHSRGDALSTHRRRWLWGDTLRRGRPLPRLLRLAAAQRRRMAWGMRCRG